MGLLGRLPALTALVVAITSGAVEGFYIGGGLTILSRNDLDGESTSLLLAQIMWRDPLMEVAETITRRTE